MTLLLKQLKPALIFTICIILACGNLLPCLAESDYTAEYTGITKKILLAGVELERFSLKYRLESCKRPIVDKLIFFGTQETGAATGLAFEVSGVQQFGRGRRRLLAFDKSALGRGLRSAEIGSIITASGSSYELAANIGRYAKARRKGLDTASANKFVAAKLKEVDALIAQRKTLVEANTSHPAYERAVLEGKILDAMRGTFVNEYATFSTNTRCDAITKNMFFLLNATYNTIGACAADYGWRSLNSPKFGGTTNVLFTITGAMAIATPLLCSAQMRLQRHLMYNSQMRRFHGNKNALAEVSSLLKEAQALPTSDSAGTLVPSLPATQRFGIYSDSNHLFINQLESEVHTMRELNKVALQSSLAGPAIGSLLMTQGILGSRAYYDYAGRLRKQLSLNYNGSVCGTVGTSMAVVGNAAWMLASFSYEHHLKEQKRLPEQLIQERLNHLDALEKEINTL